MPDESSASVNSKIGIDYQRKFTFYTVTLTFTILALAIQTANLGTYFVIVHPHLQKFKRAKKGQAYHIYMLELLWQEILANFAFVTNMYEPW